MYQTSNFNRPYSNAKPFKRQATNLNNPNQYFSNETNYQNSFSTSRGFQNTETFSTNFYGTASSSNYNDEPNNDYQPNNQNFCDYNTSVEQPNRSEQNQSNRPYETFGQFRQYFSNREEKPKQRPLAGNAVAPSLFMGKDASYPDELNNQMNPFFCALCNARLNSIKSANIHYESKAHDRHITAWIKKTYTDNGLDAINLKRFVTEISIEAPGVYRCELCQLELSSAQHALQHYNGKRHRHAAIKISPITGIGYFNVEGKWVKTGKVVDEKTGEETLYLLVKTPSGFEPVVLQKAPNLQPSQKRTNATVEKATNDEPPIKKPHLDGNQALKEKQENHYKSILHNFKIQSIASVKSPTNPDANTKNQFQTLSLQTPIKTEKTALQTPQEALESCQCKLCGIATTSKDQMLLHLKGQKHSKKLKSVGADTSLSTMFQGAPITILESLDNNDPKDISMYRTPSGSYYCKLCNAAFADVARIKNHIVSKKHLAIEKNKGAGEKPASDVKEAH